MQNNFCYAIATISKKISEHHLNNNITQKSQKRFIDKLKIF